VREGLESQTISLRKIGGIPACQSRLLGADHTAEQVWTGSDFLAAISRGQSGSGAFRPATWFVLCSPKAFTLGSGQVALLSGQPAASTFRPPIVSVRTSAGSSVTSYNGRMAMAIPQPQARKAALPPHA
jgi:hypothetical protein